jgi:hypothetical protein
MLVIAKRVQAEAKESLLALLRRNLFYAKIAQTERNQACL